MRDDNKLTRMTKMMMQMIRDIPLTDKVQLYKHKQDPKRGRYNFKGILYIVD